MARIRRLTLSNFRNYRAATLDADGWPIVLVGPNGAGKTNLIEAISFLAPGRGLRRAAPGEVAFHEGDGSWAVAAEIEGALGLATLGTGIERVAEDETLGRQCRIDRETVTSAAAFADHLRVVWLVPAMDTLFAGAPSERRRFLDRLALAVDAEHAGRVNALDRALRGRNRLLSEPAPDRHWLDAIEHETAELAVAVAAVRAEAVSRLAAVLASRKDSNFPPAEIAIEGWMEKLLPAHPAVEVEERYRGVLRDNRSRDAAAGRTLDGPHLTDLAVVYARKGIAAADASTGEQKALLIGLVLAQARLITEMSGSTPVLLLDEVVAHLDPSRRAALHAELATLGAQVWMTGADPAQFAEVARDVAMFEVNSGRLQRNASRRRTKRTVPISEIR
ncbi:MAG: DNA replication/repair protein RecF [Hyphomicrobiales bacterium]|nr:DNA replication/repair protein RecF [Hyphomicrobiales bacterium]MDE2284529.1 DNA replication/repair protein RecF [Hyphomicrobiales bacterium]